MYWTVVFVVVLLLVVAGFFIYSGLLYSPVVHMSRPTSIPRRAAYVLKRGPYKGILPECGKLQKIASGARHFGLYYDDPKKVSQDKLRYIAGCCLPDEEGSRLEKELTSAGYKIIHFPDCGKAVMTEFPYRNMLSMMFAIWKVYPNLYHFYTKHNLHHKTGPIFEVYEEDKIRFYAPTDDVEKYFVPGVDPQ